MILSVSPGQPMTTVYDGTREWDWLSKFFVGCRWRQKALFRVLYLETDLTRNKICGIWFAYLNKLTYYDKISYKFRAVVIFQCMLIDLTLVKQPTLLFTS